MFSDFFFIFNKRKKKAALDYDDDGKCIMNFFIQILFELNELYEKNSEREIRREKFLNERLLHI